jgi:hypothetical protein
VPRRVRRLASGKKIRSADPSLVLVTAASWRRSSLIAEELIAEELDARVSVFGCGSRQREAFRCPSAGLVYQDMANSLARLAGATTARRGARPVPVLTPRPGNPWEWCTSTNARAVPDTEWIHRVASKKAG